MGFEWPVQAETDVFYNVSAILNSNELDYFGQEGMTEMQCGKATFQFSFLDSTNGTGVQEDKYLSSVSMHDAFHLDCIPILQ